MAFGISEIARRLALKFPDRINPPISTENEAELRNQGLPIADEVIQLLSVFDGEKPAIYPMLKEARFIPSVGEGGIAWHLQLFQSALDEPQVWAEFPIGCSESVRKVRFSSRWTPFMENDSGDVWFVDHDPSDSGIDGQVFLMNVGQGCDVAEVVAPSVEELLTELIAKL